MYNKIVVPLDGSKLAEVALPYAEEMAAKMGSDIILLTVLESDEPQEHEKQQMYTEKVAEVTRYHAAKYLGNGGSKAVKIAAATRTGNPAEAIIDYADKGDYTLIIMASHGRSGISRWAVGSVADKVVRAKARQPVMLIRAKESRSDVREKRVLKKVLVPLDGSPGGQTVIPFISKIASRLDMELTLLQVVSQNGDTTRNAETYLQDECRKLAEEGITSGYRVSKGTVADRIIDLADELAFDLVAMSTRGRTGVSAWPMGSTAQKVFLGGNTPLLLIKQY